jgi:hypothetical protein
MRPVASGAIVANGTAICGVNRPASESLVVRFTWQAELPAMTGPLQRTQANRRFAPGV